MTMSYGYKMVYLVGLSMTTFYQATRVMRQMGHSQGVPPEGRFWESVPITASVATAIRAGWARGLNSIKPGDGSGRETAHVSWLIKAVWPIEKKRRVALLSEIEGTPISTKHAEDDSLGKKEAI